MVAAWHEDEFVLDPCRITLSIGLTGIEGDTFKRVHLMDRFGVQVNKTSRNTVLFMTHIGTTRSSVAYLIEVLVEIVRQLDDEIADLGPRALAAHEADVQRLTVPTAPLPNFSAFHEKFREARGTTPEGDIRGAFFTAYHDELCTYLSPDEVMERLARDEAVVSATFVTPYPPGFPVLVPGQCFSTEIMEFMASLDTPEVHGYRPELGYRVFTAEALGDGSAPDAAAAPERSRLGRRRRADPGPTGEEKPADQPLTAAGDTPGGS
jgi:arginine decarboxylase